MPDPYFSATKLEWLLARRVDAAGRSRSAPSTRWLVWKLTGGAAHVTDATNASRTLLARLEPLDWDDELLALFGVARRACCPRIVPSSGVVGEARARSARACRSRGIAGDQQAALFGQGCFGPGDAKATYGTGSFVLVNTGRARRRRRRTASSRTAAARARRDALEGAVFVTGAAVQWLRDGLGMIADAAETEALARIASSRPAASTSCRRSPGLGSPHWDADARGLITGHHARHRRAPHLVRAALEAIALPDRRRRRRRCRAARTRAPRRRRRDREPRCSCSSRPTCSGCRSRWPASSETTALGAAALAGLAVGVWSGLDEVAAAWRLGARYEPAMGRDEAAERLAGWHAAVERARSRARDS